MKTLFTVILFPIFLCYGAVGLVYGVMFRRLPFFLIKHYSLYKVRRSTAYALLTAFMVAVPFFALFEGLWYVCDFINYIIYYWFGYRMSYWLSDFLAVFLVTCYLLYFLKYVCEELGGGESEPEDDGRYQ